MGGIARPAALAWMWLLLAGQGLWAWEADVHFGLTKWLALKAGFAPDEADRVAGGNIQVDDSWVTGPIQSSLLSCPADPSGATTVHDNHFPSKVDVRKAPALRAVDAGTVWRTGVPRPIPAPGNLDQLGQYLHALQDSWSHQLEPDVPPTCDPELAWSHAERRGGWSCHLADLTYRWPNDVEAMAQATYHLLQARSTGKPADWTTLVPDVRAFARRRSKWDKDEWFRAQWTGEPWFAARLDALEFLQGSSLPDCSDPGPCQPYPFALVVEHAKRIGAGRRALDVPPQIVSFAEGFLRAMARDSFNDVMNALDAGLAQAALRDALSISGPCQALVATAVPLMLTRGMVRGDGGRQPLALCELALEERLRGRPLSCAQALEGIRRALNEPVRVGPSLEEMRKLVPEGPDYDYDVRPGRGPNTWVGIARFKHIFSDVLVLHIGGTLEEPRVTGFGWLPRQ